MSNPADKDQQIAGLQNEIVHLVRLLCEHYPSGVSNIPGLGDNCGTIFIDLPTGQISFNYHNPESHLFVGLPDYEGDWDLHTQKGAYARINELIRRLTTERLNPTEIKLGEATREDSRNVKNT